MPPAPVEVRQGSDVMDATMPVLCQASTGQEDDWKNLYEGAFPQDERMLVDEVRQMLSKGSMMLHKTYNKAGELLCFSLVFQVTDFLLLSYIATDATKRSGGVGSKHMKALLGLLKAQFANHVGLFLEIESTKEQGLDAEEQKVRNRRLDFYRRLGSKRLCRSYILPNLSQPGGPTRAGELLWFEFGTKAIDETILPRVIREIYERAYNLPPADPIIQQVLGQLSSGAAGNVGTPCVCQDPPLVASPATPSAQPATEPETPSAKPKSDNG